MTALAQRPLPAALLAQGLGAFAVWALQGLVPQYALAPAWFAEPGAWAWVQGFCAALAALALRAPWWWLPIHLVFVPLAFWVHRFGLAPGWYLLAFVALLLTYWRTDRTQVPLYLSNRITADGVAALLPGHPSRMIDLGCGHAGLLRQVARQRPDCSFVGIEHAPLPWLIGLVLSWRVPNLKLHYGDFWRRELAEFDLVYVFLSPIPMPALWRKVNAEMRAGTMLVSNSFIVPEQEPEAIRPLDDRRGTRLLIYRVPARS